MAIELDTSAMQQLQAEQRALLDTIDELRVLGLGRFVDLPQLIVVGDQSAGKSSVLEAISRVRFPMRDGACTRFATELVLRQSPQTKVDVKVQNENVEAFSRSGFSKNDLPLIIEEAKQRMGVAHEPTSFSEEVLRVEISGPDVPQLTLVDLPGFYHNRTKDQGMSGVAIVDRLAEKYMQQENSIILAVISAQSELAAQKVLEEAKKHDPSGMRTLGILTKPDKVEEDSNNEKTYLRLAQNDEDPHKLELGWHVLRNRAQKEIEWTDTERDEAEEKFFRSGVWSTISRRDRGIEALREKLSQVLLSHIQQKLPALIARIEDHTKNHQARLRELGDARSAPTDLRKYLTSISTRFQRLALEAVQGNYLDDFFGGLYPDPAATSYTDRRIRKLRALVRDMNRAFYHVLSTKGERRHIQWDTDDGSGNFDKDKISAAEDENNAAQGDEQNDLAPDYLQPLINLYDIHDPSCITVVDLKDELEALASENQGVEFPGSPNDKITLRLFRDQSQPWEDLANQHVDRVTEFAHSFVETLIFHVTGPDSKTADSVLRNFVNTYFDKKKVELRAKLAELLRHLKTGYDPQPLYTDFHSTAERQRNERLTKKVLQNLEQEYPGVFSNSKEKLGREALTQAVLKASTGLKSEFNAEQIIDNMSAYYEMTLKVFTNNVMILALENCLISDIPDIFTPDKVHEMSDDTVIALAAESRHITREREELQAQLQKLQQGLAACQEYRPRRSVVGLSKSTRKLPALMPPPESTPKSVKTESSRPGPSSNPAQATSTSATPPFTALPTEGKSPDAKPPPPQIQSTVAQSTKTIVTARADSSVLAPGSQSVLNQPAAPATGHGLFSNLGAPPTQASGPSAGEPAVSSRSLFSGTPLPSGQQTSASSIFAAKPATTTSGLFGSTLPTSGQQAPAYTGGLFGGARPAQPAQVSQSTGIFGNPVSNKPVQTTPPFAFATTSNKPSLFGQAVSNGTPATATAPASPLFPKQLTGSSESR